MYVNGSAECSTYRLELQRRFRDSRFKAIVLLDDSLGRVTRACVNLYCLHDERTLLIPVNRSDDEHRIWFDSIMSAELVLRTEDGSPRYADAMRLVQNYLDSQYPGWDDETNRSICIDVVYGVPVSRMRGYRMPQLL